MPSLSASIFAYVNNPVNRIANESSILIAQISKQVSNQNYLLYLVRPRLYMLYN